MSDPKSPGEAAAYAVADQKLRRHKQRAFGLKALRIAARTLWETSKLIFIAGAALITLGLAFTMWPLAIVFLLFLILLK